MTLVESKLQIISLSFVLFRHVPMRLIAFCRNILDMNWNEHTDELGTKFLPWGWRKPWHHAFYADVIPILDSYFSIVILMQRCVSQCILCLWLILEGKCVNNSLNEMGLCQFWIVIPYFLIKTPRKFSKSPSSLSLNSCFNDIISS